MNSFLGTSGLTYLWGKIKDAVSVKADKIQEVNHGTSDTTFTLTPNVMHIWDTVSSLNLSLPTDSNSTLDEYLFTFTCPTGGTTLTLPASIVWIQEPEFEEGKTYQVSIVNGLAGFLTNNMVAGSGGTPGTETDPIFKASPAYGIAASDITNWNSKQAALVSGTNIKTVNNESLLGSGNISIQGGGGDTNVIEVVKVNGTALTPDSNKAVDVPVPTESTISGWGFTKNTGTYSKPSTGIPKTDLASAVQTSLGKADTALQSYTETDPVFTASAAHGITSANITSWNNKVSNVQADWNATSGLAVILNKPTNLVTTTSLNTALNDYLPLAGGTMTGRLITRDVGSVWANGFFPNYSAITFPAIDDNQYHPYLHGTSSDGSVWNLGGYWTGVGIYGYVADHEGNNTDWSTWWDTTNGYLTHTGRMKVGGQITSSVANGTAPLVVASTTLNTNLNADLLDGYHAEDVSRLGWTTVSNATSGTNCKWYSVGVPTSNNSWYIYDIIVRRSLAPYIAYYRLSVMKFSAGYNVVLINQGIARNTDNNTHVCVGIDATGNVYIQHGTTGAINYMSIRPIIGAGSINTTEVGAAAFGAADGFTAVKMIKDDGYVRLLTNGSSQTTTYDGTPAVITSLQIGNAYVWWDDANNCLRITGADSSGNPSASIATNLDVSGMVAVYSGSSAPSSSMGNDGDIYIQTS